MRLNRPHISTPKEAEPRFISPRKPLLAFGYGCLLIVGPFLIAATPNNLIGQEPFAPVGAPNAGPIADSPVVSQTSDNSQTPDNSQAPNNSQTSPNPQVPNTPLLPQQGANPYLPFSTSPTSISNTQSPQITSPTLYMTGVNDLSQIATNAALSQAFSEQPISGFLSEPGLGYSYPPIERIRLGPFDVKAAVSTNLIVDDNIQASPGGQKMSGTSIGITPAILLEYGAEEGQKGYASVVYAPTITRFFQHSAENTDNQNVSLNVQYPFQRLSVNFGETYAQATGINQDTNQRTTQTSTVTSLGGTYEVDDKLSLNTQLQELVTSYPSSGGQGGAQGQGDTTTSLNSSLLYHLTEKITVGPGLNVGVDKPQGVSQDTFEQGLVVVDYQPTEKINLFAQGGAEFLEYDGGGDKANPIFSAGIGYKPFDSTVLTVNASQSLRSSSADSTQTVVSTGVGFTASQRFLQRFYLNFAFSYSHMEDQSGSGGAPQSPGSVVIATATPGSTQDNIVYRPSLTFAPTAWTNVAIYYQYLDNESSVQGSSYHDNQMGISVSGQF